jgi:lambda family phage portal protein
MRRVRHTLPSIQPTGLDKLVGFFSPGALRDRLAARMQISALTGGYKGARRDRRPTQNWQRRTDSADGALLPDLQDLRDSSRDLLRNNPLAAGAINTTVTNVIGLGLKCRPQIDREFLGLSQDQATVWEREAERLWRLWSETPECDLSRVQTFDDMQDTAFRSVLEAGDVFAIKRFVERAGSDFALKVQMVEADRVSNPSRQRDVVGLSGGVESDANGAPVAYHVLNEHPGDQARGAKAERWLRVRAFGGKSGRRRVLHVLRRKRIGQSRGEPYLAPVIEALKQLGDYTEAELQAAVISSFFTVFVKTEAGEGLGPMEPTTETGAASGDSDVKLAAGAIVDLANGEDIVTANPNRPNDAFDPFVQAVLRQIGVALELPFEILIKHFTASYSAARAAMLDAWKFFRARRQWFSRSFNQPLYEEVLLEAVARGMLDAPGFFDSLAVKRAYCGAVWVGPAQGQIDPLKENQADEIAEDRAWKTAAQITAEKTGGDWERNHEQRAREQSMRQEAGLAAAPVTPAAPEREDEGEGLEKEDAA